MGMDGEAASTVPGGLNVTGRNAVGGNLLCISQAASITSAAVDANRMVWDIVASIFARSQLDGMDGNPVRFVPSGALAFPCVRTLTIARQEI